MCQIIAARKANPDTQQCFANYPEANGKLYGWTPGQAADCPVTCDPTPNDPNTPTRSQGFVCTECSSAPTTTTQGSNICTTPTPGTAPVANTMCAQPQPNPINVACPPLPACGVARCGDGRVDIGEECDGGACCNAACKKIECDEIDACFHSVKNLKTY